MKKFLISFVATSFLLIILFYAFDKNSLSSKNKLNPNSGLSKLSEKGKKLLMIFLRDEMQTHLSGGDSPLDNDFESNGLTPIPVSSSKLQDDYESNEVLGDRNYRNKLLMITGKVLSINRSIGENYFISLAGGVNSVMTPQAKMKDGYIDYLSGLKKGNEISIICHGNGMLIGSAMLEECVPLDKWVDIAAKSIFESLPAMIKDKNKSMTILVLMSDIIKII